MQIGVKIVVYGVLFGVGSGVLNAAEPDGLSVSERYSYAMGVQLGQLLRAQGVSRLDSDAFAAAIDDVLAGRPLRLDPLQMQAAVRDQQRLFAEQRAARAAVEREEEQAFLAANARNPDIVVLPDGLQYRILQRGVGARPGDDDSVRVHYQGALTDGTVFDSSYTRGTPADFALGGVIPGFREALAMMQVGDRWQVFVPSALAYGEQGAGKEIGPYQTLVFDIELLDVLR